MSLFHIMDVAESLLQLDPIRTYPRRGAEQVARTIRADRYALRRDGCEPIASELTPAGEPSLSLLLRSGRDVLGHLDLYFEEGTRLGEDELRLARWGARVFSRGLGFCERLAHEGGRRSGESVRMALERAPLTPRERDVVELLVCGCSTRAISNRTGLTVSTVNTYLKRIFSKLGVHSRVELVARVAGTADPEPAPLRPAAAPSA